MLLSGQRRERADIFSLAGAPGDVIDQLFSIKIDADAVVRKNRQRTFTIIARLNLAAPAGPEIIDSDAGIRRAKAPGKINAGVETADARALLIRVITGQAGAGAGHTNGKAIISRFSDSADRVTEGRVIERYRSALSGLKYEFSVGPISYIAHARQGE